MNGLITWQELTLNEDCTLDADDLLNSRQNDGRFLHLPCRYLNHIPPFLKDKSTSNYLNLHIG